MAASPVRQSAAAARAEPRRQAAALARFARARRPPGRADAAQEPAGHGCGHRVAVAGAGRVRGGILAGRRADPQAAAGAPTRTADLPDVSQHQPRRCPEDDVFSDPLFVRLRDAARGQVDLFAMGYPNKPRVTFDAASGDRETVRTQFVSGDAFDRLGVGAGGRPAAHAAGRSAPRRASRGRPEPRVLDAAVRRRSRGSSDAGSCGTTPKEDRQFQIVGVAEPRFTGVEPGHATDVWLPYAMHDASAFGNSRYRTLRVIGRVKENVPLEQAQSVLQVAFTNLRRDDAPASSRRTTRRSASRSSSTRRSTCDRRRPARRRSAPGFSGRCGSSPGSPR